MNRGFRQALLKALLIACALASTSQGVVADEPTVDELLMKTDDLMRGSSSESKVSVSVKTARWERQLTMKILSEGTEKTLIQILSPAKEKGTATLKVGKNIWNYLPKVDRTIKVPTSMMSGSWMGTHFTNDDLVKESRYVEDYDRKMIGRPDENGQGHYLIECIPKPDAPVVWGKVLVRVRAADELVDEITFYDEKNQLVRTFSYSDIGELGGRMVPRRMQMIPTDKPEEFTEIFYEEAAFDVTLPDRTFTLQALRR